MTWFYEKGRDEKIEKYLNLFLRTKKI